MWALKSAHLLSIPSFRFRISEKTEKFIVSPFLRLWRTWTCYRHTPRRYIVNNCRYFMERNKLSSFGFALNWPLQMIGAAGLISFHQWKTIHLTPSNVANRTNQHDPRDVGTCLQLFFVSQRPPVSRKQKCGGSLLFGGRPSLVSAIYWKAGV